MEKNTKMCWIKYSTKRNQIKIEKIEFRNSILKYDVIHDVLKVICYKKLQRRRNFGDMEHAAVIYRLLTLLYP